MKLNKKARELAQKELPWFESLVPKEMSDFFVKVIELDVLSLTPCASWCDGWQNTRKILLLDKQGEILLTVGRRNFCYILFPFMFLPRCKWKWIRSYSDKDFPESVEQALERLGEKMDEVYYILHLKFPTKEVFLHRLPKNMSSLKAWVEHQVANSAKELHSSLKD